MKKLAEEILKRERENEDAGWYKSRINNSASSTENSDIFSSRLFGLEHDIWSSGLCLWSIGDISFVNFIAIFYHLRFSTSLYFERRISIQRR